MKILLVDDEAPIRNVLSRFLRQQEGVQVITAVNGEDALGVLQDNTDVDTIVLDVLMPVMGAKEFLPILGQENTNPNLHVVVISGYLGDMTVNELRNMIHGVKFSFLPKPFGPNDLNRIIFPKF